MQSIPTNIRSKSIPRENLKHTNKYQSYSIPREYYSIQNKYEEQKFNFGEVMNRAENMRAAGLYGRVNKFVLLHQMISHHKFDITRVFFLLYCLDKSRVCFQ